MRLRWDRGLTWGLLVLLLVSLSATQGRIAKVRQEGNYRGAGLPIERLAELPVQDLSLVTIGAILGGFRSVVANILWLKCDEYWHQGRVFRLVPLAKAVVLLEPHFIEAWRITAWHLAYNMSVEAPTPEKAREYIEMGLKFLEEGIKWNPDRYELFFELGWTYYDKLNEYEKAAAIFQQALQKKDEFGSRPPTYIWRMIAHAYERYPRIDEAVRWWQIDAQVEPDHPVHRGALQTIHERYVRAWKHFERGELDEAMAALLEDWQKDDPYDTIGMHFKARIYERKQDIDRAIETWFEAARHSAVDKLARRRVIELCRLTGRPLPKGINDVGLPTEVRDEWDRWFQENLGRHAP